MQGGPYAPYLLAPYTQTNATIAGTSVATSETIYYLLSTWNPYVVDTMASTLTNDDVDGDTVPNEVDNCPTVANPDQANCNLEAERAWNANNLGDAVPLFGDACDPVPCPLSDTNAVTSSYGRTCDPPTRDAYVPQFCSYHEIHDQIDLAPIGSHALEPAGGVVSTSTEHVEKNVPTHGRFCEKVPANLSTGQPAVTCLGSDILADNQLRLGVPAEFERADVAFPWHRITLVSPTAPFLSDRDESVVFSFDYGGGATGSLRWTT